MRALPWLMLGLVWGCAEHGGTVHDDVAPTSTGRVVFPGGGAASLENGDILSNGADVRVVLAASEAGSILYTLDGTDPTLDNPVTSTGGATTLFSVTTDTQVRWRARDRAGNLEPAIHHGRIRFDRQSPNVTYTPDSGTFAGPVTVHVVADEPATVYWALDDHQPFEGSMYTQKGDAPLDIVLRRSTRLRVRTVDAAGNSTDSPSLVFTVDAQPPITRAVPPGGRYFAPVTVDLVSDDPTATLHYTTDGAIPSLDSPLWGGPLRVAADLVLRFRGVDPGGNLEAAHIERYQVGAGPARAAQGEAIDDFPVGGGMALAGALMDAAGLMSGRDGAVGFGRDWQAWATGRTAAEAYLLQSGIGLHGIYAPSVRALAASLQASPDADGNGTNLDETLDALVQGLADRVGAVVPQGLFPVYAFYEEADSRLVRPLTGRTDDAGLPEDYDDFSWLRWQGVGRAGRVLTASTLAGGIAALTARARAGLAGDHVAGGDAVASVIELRCGGCHRVGGAPPVLATPTDWLAAELVKPGAPENSPLVGLLAGGTPHKGDPATPEQVNAVVEWIRVGAMFDTGAARQPGFEGREAFFALLAASQAAWAAGRVVDDGAIDAQDATLTGIGDDDHAHYAAGQIAVTEGASAPGLPRRPDRIRLDDPALDTGAHGRLLSALVDLDGLLADHPDAVPAGDAAAVHKLMLAEARSLLELTWDSGRGVFRAGWRPGDGATASIDTAGAADAAVALLAYAARVPGDRLDPAAAANGTIDFLARLKDANGNYASRWDLATSAADTDPRRLDVQLAVLDAFVARGDAASARALWAVLSGPWWDEASGVWETTFGEAEATYDPALAARVVRVLGRGVESGVLPDAGDRLGRFYDTVVARGLRTSETWLTGEVGTQPDADGDGTPKPWGVALGNGVAPAFAARAVVR